jgi:hypothetical protein
MVLKEIQFMQWSLKKYKKTEWYMYMYMCTSYNTHTHTNTH